MVQAHAQTSLLLYNTYITNCAIQELQCTPATRCPLQVMEQTGMKVLKGINKRILINKNDMACLLHTKQENTFKQKFKGTVVSSLD